MVLFWVVIGVIVAVLGVAVVYDLRARRHRGVSSDFRAASRDSARREAQSRDATEARSRPSKMGGRGRFIGGGPGP